MQITPPSDDVDPPEVEDSSSAAAYLHASLFEPALSSGLAIASSGASLPLSLILLHQIIVTVSPIYYSAPMKPSTVMTGLILRSLALLPEMVNEHPNILHDVIPIQISIVMTGPMRRPTASLPEMINTCPLTLANLTTVTSQGHNLTNKPNSKKRKLTLSAIKRNIDALQRKKLKEVKKKHDACIKEQQK